MNPTTTKTFSCEKCLHIYIEITWILNNSLDNKSRLLKRRSLQNDTENLLKNRDFSSKKSPLLVNFSRKETTNQVPKLKTKDHYAYLTGKE